MNMHRLLSFAREMTPPLIFRGIRSLVYALSPGRMGENLRRERSAEWYDAMYESSTEYRKHYTESTYYFSWTVVVDRMTSHSPEQMRKEFLFDSVRSDSLKKE